MTLRGDATDSTATCYGKHRFPSLAQARKVAKRSASTHCERINAYHCPHCAGWHIGSHLPRPRRK
ncbi:hypothetical protein GPA27_13595 [Aromatoleum toluolicum]|uniref:Uncharacterized protein n=1 Tax=Aromatoleum toluolicum TaxID=90060 RepID=A0ABX1NH10_9RHOO|nr:hypothetical protein [Aromatoleum toluolicum]NMF98420.1 hypothetical protein [Aromatoleum toluolicum]